MVQLLDMDDMLRPRAKKPRTGGVLDGFLTPQKPTPADIALKNTDGLNPITSDTPKVAPKDPSHTPLTKNDFKLPEEVAEADGKGTDIFAPDNNPNASKFKPTNRPKYKWLAWIKKPNSKKQWIIASIIIALVLVIAGVSAWWFLIRSKPAAKPTVTQAVTPKPVVPTTVASLLSGLQVDPSVNKRPVTAVMIENSQDARPQAGLKDASVVFEAVAEGGITRFNALFQDTQPDYIGPVRSVRPYYIDWFAPFDAAIAHVGGSPQGLADLKALKIKDLDQFANAGSYTRVTTRFAPHNVYTSTEKLNALETAKGFGAAVFTGFTRKKEAPPKPASTTPTKATTNTTAKPATTVAPAPVIKTIDLNISSSDFNVHYDYDPASNSYLRSEGGLPHKDDRSGLQISPKVVIAIVMPRGIAKDGQHTDYQAVGSGKMFVFQDGTSTEGTWSKDSRQTQWKFTDTAGKVLALNPGQTWITMVDTAGAVVAKP